MESVRISAGARARVQSVAACASGAAIAGWLVGTSSSEPQVSSANGTCTPAAITIHSAASCLHRDLASGRPDLAPEARELSPLLPGGLAVVGVILGSSDSQESNGALQDALAVAKGMATLLGETTNDSQLVVAVSVSEGGQLASTSSLGNSVQVSVLPVEEDLWLDRVLLRCHFPANLPLYSVDASASKGPLLATAFAQLRKDLLSPNVVGLVDGSSPGGTQQTPICVQLPKALKVARDLGAEGGEKGDKTDSWQGATGATCHDLRDKPSWLKLPSGFEIPAPVQVKVLFTQARGRNACSSPAIRYLPANGSCRVSSLQLQMDVLALAPRQLSVQDAVAHLVLPTLLRQVEAMEQAARLEKGSAIKLAAFHFCPAGYSHPVTAVYSLAFGEAEKGAVEMRKALHQRLGLPLNRPALRIANALTWAGEASPAAGSSTASKRLLDVHVGLGPSGVVGGHQCLISGSYEYFHYMQDKIDDSGWGCAYRSLQTLISWFRLQHYTAVAVPSHRRIQELLVEMGDKEAQFIGSSQWIGAIELSYILDSLIGVQSKVLTVQSGADMSSMGRQLAHHFRTQGSPVMIGGGVLAYTLLGVDYNEMTGDCGFLILDPHYPGREDLKSIRGGGWVGWKKAISDKGQSFFVRDAFYNLLLPQRPEAV